MKKHRLLIALAVLALAPGAQATERSYATKAAFARLQACPATAKNTVSCPGFVIDDKVALDCGGTDTVGNKQWLTDAAGRTKDRYERNGAECKHRTHGVMQ